ncbi:2Fe-2S iron-sulfur cluster-binding protein [Candidatus Aminicenantes bacterium AC-335-K20]|jgi:NADH dehydrogenase/NADH:ubiquinone oxidoreductase subunit G|nr:2Fe-2S iron-sulfur cluster-binding protein [SCandidatus Aminicenantes bacterium Aminicenantia_JdfR_composite]MCP2618913.1 2Fe-2S iron-sulfur cluster-binding protein [Candidatus Aminicenantes bacterium AC-335-A11]MCP2619578.1 2Fe-2S iron-sulfur cluster-binding protein [Candidatus Aminicenantes bacterium AC-335-K20]MCP2621105.1 2Fe-2S iron-sulfur cluster-binding protein [Candidatus Aminicenantes bacterium AC-334-E05]
MIKLIMNNLEVEAEEGWTILETAKFYGLEIPTLCYNEGLTPYGGCRLCLVEIGEGEKSKLVTSCTYPVEEGLIVRTDTKRVIQARRMMIELMLSVAPFSKTIQDLASKFGVTKARFKPRNEECILCGLCVRMCHEQMDAQAIGFVNRGKDLRITTPFDIRSERCRLCGGCIYICPACQLRCQGPGTETALCNACLTMEPTCLDYYDELQCWMYDAGRCGTCVREEPKK